MVLSGGRIQRVTQDVDMAEGSNYEVHLPTRLNPIFRVRDYGRGISPENMRNVYGKLYASTKRRQ